MRKLDVLILFCVAIGLLYTFLIQEHSIRLQRSFFEPIVDAENEENHHSTIVEQNNEQHLEHANMPHPLIADFDGDGFLEMVMVTNTNVPTLKLFDLKQVKQKNFFVSQLTFEKFLQLPLQRRVQIQFKQKHKQNFPLIVVGLGSGIFSPNAKQQHIIVVLSNWKIICFDSQLKIVWQTKIEAPHDKYEIPSEVQVSVLPNRIHNSDQGLVIIGLRRLVNARIDSSFHEGDVDMGHYSLFAFSGKDGSLKWNHDQPSDVNFKTSGENIMHSIHQYKMDLEHETMHTGEVFWRNYFLDMLRQLPHSFRHPHDADIQPDYFTPIHNRKLVEKEQKTSMQQLQEALKQFSQTGLNVLEKKKNWIDLKHQLSSNKKYPNVIVARLRNSVEVVHLYTGRTLVSLSPLQEYKAYADINGDGSIDVISVVGCNAVLESGAPSNLVKVSETSICETHSLIDRFSPYLQDTAASTFFMKQKTAPTDNKLGFVTPAIVTNFDGSIDSVFFASSGLITSLVVDSDGQFDYKYQVSSRSTFTEDYTPEEAHNAPQNGEDFHYPELVPFASRSKYSGIYHNYIAAVGKQVLTILDSQKGTVVETEDLPFVSIAPVLIRDFDGDGMNDLIFISKEGVYGYRVVQSNGVNALTFCLLFLVCILVLMYLSTQIELPSDKFVNIRKSKKTIE